MSNVLWIVIAVVALVLFVTFILYNRLVKLRNFKDESIANIATQEQRRYDLIGNLIETVKGYAKHEASVLDSVTKYRAQASNIGHDVQSIEQANQALNTARKELSLTVENYPELKASQNFMALQEELTSTENKISYARSNFNSRVRDYNTALETIPTNIIAKLCGFKKTDLFTVSEPEASKPVKVSF